jgi:hypothetical protein
VLLPGQDRGGVGGLDPLRGASRRLTMAPTMADNAAGAAR